MTTDTLPTGLPPLPPVPYGYDRWEYRGTNYSASKGVHDHCEDGDRSWFRQSQGYDQTWDLMADDGTHVIEAVREPATSDEAREILAATLKALPVGYLPAHTPESIPERVADLVTRYAEAERQRDAYAETLREIDESGLIGNTIRNRHPELAP